MIFVKGVRWIFLVLCWVIFTIYNLYTGKDDVQSKYLFVTITHINLFCYCYVVDEKEENLYHCNHPLL